MEFLRHIRLLLSIALLLFSRICLGSVQLFIVQPTDQHERYILVAQDGETPAQALSRYKTLLTRNAELSSLVSPDQLKQFRIHSGVGPFKLGEKPAVLILANRGYDLTAERKHGGQLRVEKFKDKLGKANDIYVLPLAASIGLTQENRELFYQELVDKFSGVVALGGPDINPRIYRDENHSSRDVNLKRDHYEIHFLKYWIKAKKGFLFGVCRGHQLISAALGFKLIQHIDNHGDGVWIDHPIKFLKTTQNFLSRAAGVREMIVNSYHHQAVQFTPNAEVDLAAVAPDGTVEALESRDGRIVSTQFHLEFMDDIFSHKIFNKINEKMRPVKVGRCSKLFSF